MSKTKQFTTQVFQMDLNKDQIEFVTNLTGIKDQQEAMEHFAVQCVCYHLDPEAILRSVNQSIMVGFEMPDVTEEEVSDLPD